MNGLRQRHNVAHSIKAEFEERVARIQYWR